MGSGIAQVAIQAGYTVELNDVSKEQVDRGCARIAKNLQTSVEKGRMEAVAAREALGRLAGATSFESVATADLVIEAIYENPGAKKQLFMQIEPLCQENTILASNTSSISITELAASTKRPEKFIGMHFFNPVPVMKLLEITRGLSTSEETLATALAIGAKMGKVTVVAKDCPGFIVNRILDLRLVLNN